MKKNRLTIWVRSALIVAGLALIPVLFVPMWKIELSAPQYPEGLVLKIFPNKLSGNVDIINGLNHYIGMKKLYSVDFIEFTILPYIIAFFAVLCFLVAILNRKKWLIWLTTIFIAFGIIAMIDFYRWEYQYGHELNPEAAIQIPGMAYQPPLIGYKQLLNFGAYSVPDLGGYIFLGVGFIMVFALIFQIIQSRKSKSFPAKIKRTIAAASFFLLFICSCNSGPQPIKVGVDGCSFCKMTISDNRFGGEIITKKGKAYKFDDIQCLLSYTKSSAMNEQIIDRAFFANFDDDHKLIESSLAFLYKSDEFRTPMMGNIAAFNNRQSLQNIAQKMKGVEVLWKDLLNK